MTGRRVRVGGTLGVRAARGTCQVGERERHAGGYREHLHGGDVAEAGEGEGVAEQAVCDTGHQGRPCCLHATALSRGLYQKRCGTQLQKAMGGQSIGTRLVRTRVGQRAPALHKQHAVYTCGNALICLKFQGLLASPLQHIT